MSFSSVGRYLLPLKRLCCVFVTRGHAVWNQNPLFCRPSSRRNIHDFRELEKERYSANSSPATRLPRRASLHNVGARVAIMSFQDWRFYGIIGGCLLAWRASSLHS